MVRPRHQNVCLRGFISATVFAFPVPESLLRDREEVGEGEVEF
jgi:hypothetical protein